MGPQPYMVWALNNKKNIYVREGISNDSQLGTGWVLVSGIEAVDLSIRYVTYFMPQDLMLQRHRTTVPWVCWIQYRFSAFLTYLLCLTKNIIC